MPIQAVTTAPTLTPSRADRHARTRRRLTLLGAFAWALHAPAMAKPQTPKPATVQAGAAQVAGTAPSKSPDRSSSHPSKKKDFHQVGGASWYGVHGTSGMRTASGERFDPQALTGAHQTLPFGTRVKVTNLHNGRSAQLRINDRGPFRGHRILDVSRGAAEALGMTGRGIARVRLEVLGGTQLSAISRGLDLAARGAP